MQISRTQFYWIIKAMCYILHSSAKCPIPENGIHCTNTQTTGGASTSTSHDTSKIWNCKTNDNQNKDSITENLETPRSFKDCHSYRIMYRENSLTLLSSTAIPTWLKKNKDLHKAPICVEEGYSKEWTLPLIATIQSEKVYEQKMIKFTPNKTGVTCPPEFTVDKSEIKFFIGGSNAGNMIKVEHEEISSTTMENICTFGYDKMQKLGIEFWNEQGKHSTCVVDAVSDLSTLITRLQDQF